MKTKCSSGENDFGFSFFLVNAGRACLLYIFYSLQPDSVVIISTSRG